MPKPDEVIPDRCFHNETDYTPDCFHLSTPFLTVFPQQNGEAVDSLVMARPVRRIDRFGRWLRDTRLAQHPRTRRRQRSLREAVRFIEDASGLETVSYSTLSKYEQQGRVPDAAFLWAWSKAYRVSIVRIYVLLEADLSGVDEAKWSDLLAQPDRVDSTLPNGGVDAETRLLEEHIRHLHATVSDIATHAQAIIDSASAAAPSQTRNSR